MGSKLPNWWHQQICRTDSHLGKGLVEDQMRDLGSRSQVGIRRQCSHPQLAEGRSTLQYRYHIQSAVHHSDSSQHCKGLVTSMKCRHTCSLLGKRAFVSYLKQGCIQKSSSNHSHMAHNDPIPECPGTDPAHKESNP